jgi:hypothetical protein
MKKLENILAENMRRFGTKNLSEQNLDDLENKLGFDSGANRDPKTGNLINPDGDINNNGYPDTGESATSERKTIIDKAIKGASEYLDKAKMVTGFSEREKLKQAISQIAIQIVLETADYFKILDTPNGRHKVNQLTNVINKATSIDHAKQLMIQALNSLESM